MPVALIIAAVALVSLASIGGASYYLNLPSRATNDVPFTTQAPQGNWAEPWQNACEETSIIMISNFYAGETLTPQKAREEILRVFEVKNREFDQSHDESMERIAEIVDEADLNWRARVVVDPSLDDIRGELAAGRPVIIPVYAPKLTSNPSYGFKDVDYHVFVLSGYDDTQRQFIAQDPGTSRGQNFRYGYDEIMAAIHDFLDNRNYEQGRKAVLFTEKK